MTASEPSAPDSTPLYKKPFLWGFLALLVGILVAGGWVVGTLTTQAGDITPYSDGSAKGDDETDPLILATKTQVETLISTIKTQPDTKVTGVKQSYWNTQCPTVDDCLTHTDEYQVYFETTQNYNVVYEQTLKTLTNAGFTLQTTLLPSPQNFKDEGYYREAVLCAPDSTVWGVTDSQVYTDDDSDCWGPAVKLSSLKDGNRYWFEVSYVDATYPKKVVPSYGRNLTTQAEVDELRDECTTDNNPVGFWWDTDGYSCSE